MAFLQPIVSLPIAESDVTNLVSDLSAIDANLSSVNSALGTKAPLHNPTFTGIVTAPTFVGSLLGNALTATTATDPNALPLAGGTMSGPITFADTTVQSTAFQGLPGGTASGSFQANDGSTISVDWQNRTLNDSGQVASVDWQNRLLKDNGTSTSVDWNNRCLNDTGGNTILNWETPGATSLNVWQGNFSCGITSGNIGGNSGPLFTSALNLQGNSLAFDNVVSAQGNGSGTLTFTGVSTVNGLPGISTPTLSEVLGAGNHATAIPIYLDNGLLYFDGNAYLKSDGTTNVSLHAAASWSFGGATVSGVPSITFADSSVQTTAFTGGGGGSQNLSSVLGVGNDATGQNIINIGSLIGNGGLTIQGSDNTQLINFGPASSINFNAVPLNMNTGAGSGGQTLNMDNGSITNVPTISSAGVGDLTITANSTGVISLESSNGPGGGGLASINLNANALNMNTGSGSGGTTLNMDNGSILGANAVVTNTLTLPSFGAATAITGMMYCDGTHFWGYANGSWLQLDN